MTDEVTYARVGGPPADWDKIEVCFEGKWGGDWIEVNVEKCQGVRFTKDAEDNFIIDGKTAARETVTGKFSLRRREPA